MRVSFVVAALVAAVLIIALVKYWPESTGQDDAIVVPADTATPPVSALAAPATADVNPPLAHSSSNQVPNEMSVDADDPMPVVDVPVLALSDAFVIDA